MSFRSQNSFWGSLSPLGGLAGAGLLIMASARLSWAIIVVGSLLWVYGLTALTFSFLLKTFGKNIFPEKGIVSLNICIASFFGSIYILLFWLLSPFAAFEVLLLLLLVPLFFAGSGIVQQIQDQSENYLVDFFEHVSDAVSQAVFLGGLLIAFSIVREPLSYCSLTLPGTYQGMITIIQFNDDSFLPINIFASSAGALLLLGYIICLYQYGKNKINYGGM